MDVKIRKHWDTNESADMMSFLYIFFFLFSGHSFDVSFYPLALNSLHELLVAAGSKYSCQYFLNSGPFDWSPFDLLSDFHSPEPTNVKSWDAPCCFIPSAILTTLHPWNYDGWPFTIYIRLTYFFFLLFKNYWKGDRIFSFLEFLPLFVCVKIMKYVGE